MIKFEQFHPTLRERALKDLGGKGQCDGVFFFFFGGGVFLATELT